MARVVREKIARRPVFASTALHDARQATCRTCPRYNPTFGTCSLCGCNAALKSLLLTEDCPEKRWTFPDITF